MSFDLREIREVLDRVKDPVSGASITTAGLIKDIFVDGNELNISLFANKLDTSQKTNLHQAIVYGIQSEYPELNVNIHLVTKSDDLGSMPVSLPQVKHIIAVASGKGGVGKSTMAVNLAFALKRLGYKAGLLDADVYGPSIPTMLGIKGAKPQISNVYGKPKLLPIDANGIPTMSIGFIVEPEQAVVLRGPRLAGIIKQFIDDTLWPELDFLIVDLPPGTGDVQLTLVQSAALSGAILVTTPQDVALADAVKAMNMFRMEQIDVNILGVIENMSWFTPEELPDNKYLIFGQGGGQKLADLSESVLLGQVPLVLALGENADTGKSSEYILKFNNTSVFEDIANRLILQLDTILPLRGKSRVVIVK